MNASSPAYRNDTAHGIPENYRNYLDQHYFAHLQNKGTPHPKMLVVYPGGSAVGKSTLSAALRDRLGALVLENDEIKVQLKACDPQLSPEDLNKYTWQYSMDLYARLGELTSNGLVVRDGVIDWYYDRILPVFRAQGYKICIIGFDISDETRIELVRRRGDKPTISVDRLIALIPEQNMHIQRFRRSHTPDILVTEANLFDSDYIVSEVQKHLDLL